MDGRFSNPFVSELEEPGIRPENDLVSSLSGGKTSDTSSPKRRLVADPETGFAGSVRSRRAVQKRVVSVPIADVEGSRAKGEGAPPSDSWAWRKYGQKPIKGSPYPRGYYRCSSSKGCPARKQVERSRVDPTMLVVTYACEHNHAWPAARNSGNNATNTHANNAAPRFPPREPAVFSTPPEPEPEPDEKFADLEGHPPLLTDDFGWFSDVTSSPTEIAVLESPFYSGSDADVAGVLFPMREEDESMFADLGELPECSVVFRRGFCEEEESQRCSLRCGSTG
ncbi:probable WRKY transcription factor 65 isoform X2 [Magnolia sinica]|uniref:probable WRKY transcription factor 65 isoform X2 n=1 Tax=Magnolia sinica TaxID=86752 RepID=UPI00265A80A2|nr:probable WRKY transcription factor 65 isoform X2 [Magnolia sinica]